MNDPVLQEIKDRLNIADVISGYIQIKKAGVNFKAPCPFHHEKSPSLVISPQKQIWHCFGCGEGGDVFTFVKKFENLEFKDALKILADKAGVKLPTFRPENPAVQDEKELLYRINDFAARYYNKVLFSPLGKPALEYLRNRGLNEATMNRWGIGFAAEDFHALEKALAQKKVNINDLVKAGVSAKNERGQMYDRFRGRITFPIYNYFGQCVGFSARILKDDGKSALNHSAKASGSGQAKYVNSPETSIYQKSKILFGLNFAKEAIRKSDEAVIVEGQMDCIASHQAGVANVVASSGTALTEAGLMQLGRLTKNLKFCFDSDGAGQAAARRAGELALKNGFKLKLIVLTGVKDPDELIKRSPGLWQKAISEAVWFLDNYINYAAVNFEQGSVDQKHYLSTEVVPFLGYIQDALEQDHYVKQLAAKFLISEKVILDQIKKQKPENRNQKVEIESPSIANGPLLLQKEVLGGLLMFPNFYAVTGEEVAAEDFEDNAIAELVRASAGVKIDLTSVLAKEALFMVESQLEELNGNEELLVKQLLKSFGFLKANALKKQQLDLQNQIKGAELAGNKARVDEFSKLFAQVSARRQKLEKTL
jgi:DNA primase